MHCSSSARVRTSEVTSSASSAAGGPSEGGAVCGLTFEVHAISEHTRKAESAMDAAASMMLASAEEVELDSRACSAPITDSRTSPNAAARSRSLLANPKARSPDGARTSACRADAAICENRAMR
eukprot:scaffold23126_cov241-Isochrysis_galbana.AAC.5